MSNIVIKTYIYKNLIMKISFQTKEESNKKQLEYFLNLSKTERFQLFLQLSKRINSFPTKSKILTNKANFTINFKPRE